MSEADQGKQHARRFWHEITPDSLEQNLPPTAWRHEPKLNKQIQVYAQLHLLQQLIDSLPACIAYVDQDRRYQYANVTYQNWFGLKPEAIYGHTLESVIGTTAYLKVKPYVDRALAGESVFYETTLPYATAGQRFVQGNLIPDFDLEGRVKGYFALIQDISDRKAAELALKQRAAREHAVWVITQRIHHTLDLQAILATAVEAIQHHLGVDRTLIFQFTSDHSGTVIEVATQPECPLPPTSLHWQKADLRTTCLVHYGQGTVRTLDNIAEADLEVCLNPWMDPQDIKSAIVAPVSFSAGDPNGPEHPAGPLANLWGFLIVQTCRTYRIWGQDEAQLLQQVADQLAIAVQQANLLAEVRHQSEQLAAANQSLAAANRQLNQLSHQDELTQVANRRHFDKVLQQEWKRLGRLQLPLSLMMFDVDHFKQFNDHHGHPAGDSCLFTIAQTCQQTIKRSSDIVARYGGEEFAVILPSTDQAGAIALAEQIRAEVRNLNITNFETATKTIYVTISLGVASLVPSTDSSYHRLIDIADRALYQAKQQGRNRVAAAGSSPGNINPARA